MRGWVTALRIARREAVRAKGRSLLVIGLIGLPVFALAYVAVSYDTFQLTPQQEIERELGAADARLDWPVNEPVRQSATSSFWSTVEPAEPAGADPDPPELTELLPAGTRMVPLVSDSVELRTPAGIATHNAEWLELSDEIHRGRVELREGAAPGPGEIALTSQAADRFDASIGDEITDADRTQQWTVVAIVEYLQRFQEAVVFAPDPDRPAPETGVGATMVMLDTPRPVSWDQVQALNEHGIVVTSREVRLNPPPPSESDHPTPGGGASEEAIAVGTIAAGLVLVEVVLLAGPAFAVGARRRQRDLALVAANGGTPAHLRRIVLADGVVLGLAGAAAGIALGAASALGTVPLLEERLLQRPAGDIGLFPLALAGIAALAVITGLLAALVPAVIAARQPVVAGLAGRRGVVRSRRRWWVLGLSLTAAGAGTTGYGTWQVQTSLVLTGLVVIQVGVVLATPALVGLVARAGRLLPLTPRIALRDTARNRAAAAPAISAVMAAVAGALAFGMYLHADQEQRWADYSPGLPAGHATVHVHHDNAEDLEASLSAAEREEVRAALQRTLPAEQVLEVAAPMCRQHTDTGYCRIGVPLPEERVCPAERLLNERFEAAEGPVAGADTILTAEEQRAARQDPRCQEPRLWYRLWLNDALVDDGTALPALLGGDDADLAAATEVLRSGGVVVTDPRRVVDGYATLEIEEEADGNTTTREVTAPAYAVTTGANVPYVVLSPEAAADAGLATEPYLLVVATSAVPSRAEQEAAQGAILGVAGDPLRFQVEPGEHQGTDDPYLLVFAAVAAVVALAAAAIATGLAAADRRDDLATLGAVGAAPRIRRLLSLSHAGVIAGLGGLLGAAVGVSAAGAVLAALNQAQAHTWPVPGPPYQLSPPWAALGLLLLVVPAVAMLGAGLFSRSRLPIERRRV